MAILSMCNKHAALQSASGMPTSIPLMAELHPKCRAASRSGHQTQTGMAGSAQVC
jgi:hypothetical protein